jgi:hypothetical protein
VNSILWFILSAVLILLLVGSEHVLSANTEEFVQPGNLKHRRSSRRLKHVDSKSTVGKDMVNFREKIRSVFCLTALIETWLWNVSRQG